nr:unnamed protein product [Spirometra erinaceieuropaei]
MSRTPVPPSTTHSEVQGILDRLFQASGSSEFKLPSSPSFYARDPTSTTRSVLICTWLEFQKSHVQMTFDP